MDCVMDEVCPPRLEGGGDIEFVTIPGCRLDQNTYRIHIYSTSF